MLPFFIDRFMQSIGPYFSGLTLWHWENCEMTLKKMSKVSQQKEPHQCEILNLAIENEIDLYEM